MQSITDFRRAAGAAIVDNFFRGAANSAALLPASRPSVHGIERIRNVRYLDSDFAEHSLDVYRPLDASSDEPLPVCVYYHGGGFRILSKDTHWIMALAYARHGFVVFNVDYRLAPGHQFPAAHQDALAAYRWVVENAEAFGGDPTRIIVAGESAGANLAAATVVASCWQQPQPWADIFDLPVPVAAVPACGMFQVSDPRRVCRRRPISSFIQDRLDEVAEAYLGDAGPARAGRDLADPLVVLERADPPDRPVPPFFLPVGTKDPLLDDTRRMDVALRRLGAHVRTEYYPGEPHAFHAFIFRKNARRCWGHTFRFLDEFVP